MVIRAIAAQAVFSPDKMGKVTLGAGEYLYAGLNCFEPGQEHKAHVHPDQDKMYLVLEGTGQTNIGDIVESVFPGDLVLARAGVMHGMRNPGSERLVVLVLFGPPPKGR